MFFLKSAALEWAPHLKLWKFKERRGAQTSKYGSIFKLKKSLKYKSTEAAEYLTLKFALNVRPQNCSQLKILIVELNPSTITSRCLLKSTNIARSSWTDSILYLSGFSQISDMNKRPKFIHTFSVYLEVVTMLEIDINVQVLTQNLHNFVNSFMLFSYKHSRKSSSISGTMVWKIFCYRGANISDNCLKWECSSQFSFLLVDLCSQNIQNNSLIATLKYTVDNCAKTNPEKHKVNQEKLIIQRFSCDLRMDADL